jgi:hypothetical protein
MIPINEKWSSIDLKLPIRLKIKHLNYHDLRWPTSSPFSPRSLQFIELTLIKNIDRFLKIFVGFCKMEEEWFKRKNIWKKYNFTSKC